MTIARKRQVHPDTTRYYHCIGRCVRQALLCGTDRSSGRNYAHRRQWIADRLQLLAEVFAIDVIGFSIMTNHYHLVVRLAPDQAKSWSLEDVRDRWGRLYGVPDVITQGVKPGASEAVRKRAVELLELRRERLMDLSWFMKSLNEHVARMANSEDHCTGAFWEGRFKSQALLDEKALLACLAYVDLNPVRAGMADTPEASLFTSVRQRVARSPETAVPLALFRNDVRDDREPIPFCLRDYLELVDWTGRALRKDKRGSIPQNLAPILDRVGLDEAAWLRAVKFFANPTYRIVGPVDAIRMLAKESGRTWFRGTGACARIFGSG